MHCRELLYKQVNFSDIYIRFHKMHPGASLCIRVIHLKDSNKSVASYVWLKGFKIVLWIQIYHHSVIITVYKVIENQF